MMYTTTLRVSGSKCTGTSVCLNARKTGRGQGRDPLRRRRENSFGDRWNTEGTQLRNRSRCYAQTDSLEDEGDTAMLEMPHEVEERYLKLLKRQEMKAQKLTQKHSEKRKTHRVMTVSSGVLKGSPIISPSDKKVRPMMAKVRSAVFSMLASRIGVSQLPSTTRWLDLFAGTGSVGMEAISRGCGSCHFVELDPWTANEVLRRNIESLGIEDQSVVCIESVFDFLKNFSRRSQLEQKPFEFISVCPPYNDMDFGELLSKLEESDVLGSQSFLIFEYPKEVTGDLQPNLGPLVQLVNRTYGRTTVAIYGPPELNKE